MQQERGHSNRPGFVLHPLCQRAEEFFQISSVYILQVAKLLPAALSRLFRPFEAFVRFLALLQCHNYLSKTSSAKDRKNNASGTFFLKNIIGATSSVPGTSF